MIGGRFNWFVLYTITLIVLETIFVNCKLDATYERLVMINGTEVLNLGSVRVKKYNRTTVVLNGEADLLVDLDNTYEVKINNISS